MVTITRKISEIPQLKVQPLTTAESTQIHHQVSPEVEVGVREVNNHAPLG